MMLCSVNLKKIFHIIFTVLCLTGCSKPAELLYVKGSARELMGTIERNTVLEATYEYLPENPNSRDILKNYYNINDPSAIDDFCILLPSGNNISEISIFLFSNDEGRQIAENAVVSRKEKVVASCKALAPKKASIAENGEILKFANAIIMIITPNNNEEIKNIIDNTT